MSTPAAALTLGIARRRIVISQRRHHERAVLGIETAQRRHVHMVVMIVAEQYHVDLRQCLECDTRRTHALGAAERDRASSFRPYGVGEDVETARLDQHAGMPDDRGPRGVRLELLVTLRWTEATGQPSLEASSAGGHEFRDQCWHDLG